MLVTPISWWIPNHPIFLTLYAWDSSYNGGRDAFIVKIANNDDHGNSISQATKIGVDSRTAGRIDYTGDNDDLRLQVGTAGTLTVYTLGTTDTYGYLLNSQGMELARNDDTSSTNLNFRITRSSSPGTYFVRARHFSSSGTGAYTLGHGFHRAANRKAQRAVLLLHGMNSAPDTWNTLVNSRWSGKCEVIYAGVAPPPSAVLPHIAWARLAIG